MFSPCIGRKMYYVTWVLQFSILILGNMGFLLLGGKALKEIDSQFSDSPLRLQYFVVMTGVSYFVFALLVPTLSSMRRWLGISMVLTFTYITILLVVVFRDGRSNKDRNYDIIGSNNFSKVMNGFGAISAIIVCNSSGILPELQVNTCMESKSGVQICILKSILYCFLQSQNHLYVNEQMGLNNSQSRLKILEAQSV
ncbi:putative amino acid transporter, transmembrane domain-containing protein [Helianthus anomalus]